MKTPMEEFEELVAMLGSCVYCGLLDIDCAMLALQAFLKKFSAVEEIQSYVRNIGRVELPLVASRGGKAAMFPILKSGKFWSMVGAVLAAITGLIAWLVNPFYDEWARNVDNQYVEDFLLFLYPLAILVSVAVPLFIAMLLWFVPKTIKANTRPSDSQIDRLSADHIEFTVLHEGIPSSTLGVLRAIAQMSPTEIYRWFNSSIRSTDSARADLNWLVGHGLVSKNWIQSALEVTRKGWRYLDWVDSLNPAAPSSPGESQSYPMPTSEQEAVELVNRLSDEQKRVIYDTLHAEIDPEEQEFSQINAALPTRAKGMLQTLGEQGQPGLFFRLFSSQLGFPNVFRKNDHALLLQQLRDCNLAEGDGDDLRVSLKGGAVSFVA